MELNNIETKPFTLFNKGWALVCAGNRESFNFMTVSWGSMGTLWNKPIVTVFVKPIRYTNRFMHREDYFTVSLFDESYKPKLREIGSCSGEDTDKVAMSGLTPVFLEKGIGFKEAKMTFVLKKIYTDRFKKEAVPSDAHERFYLEEEEHDIFIGEVVEVFENEKD